LRFGAIAGNKKEPMILSRCVPYVSSALLLILLLALPAGCAFWGRDSGAWDRLKEQDLPYAVVSDRPWEEVKTLSDRISRIFALYGGLFGVDENALPPLVIEIKKEKPVVEKEAGANNIVAEPYPALYRTGPARIIFKGPPDDGLLLHEIAHHFIIASFDPSPPSWLNEGLATYLGWSALGEKGIVAGEIAVEHCRVVKDAAANGGLVPFSDFLRMDSKKFYRKEGQELHYSQAWALVYFLLHEQMDEGLPLDEKLKRLDSLTTSVLFDLEPDFCVFCREFPVLDLLMKGLMSRDAVRIRSSAFRLGLLQDPASMTALLDLALNPSAEPEVREVALYAAGMVFLGSGSDTVRDRYFSALRALRRDSSTAIRRAARDLLKAVREGDAVWIQVRYGAIGCDSEFYPAGGFKVRR